MATCRDVVLTAMQRLKVIGAGETIAADDMALALTALQDLVDELRGGFAGSISTVVTSAALTAEEMTLIIKNNVSGVAVTLSSVDADGQAPRDGDIIGVRDLNTDVINNYRWSDDVARWVALDALTENSEFPFGASNKSGFAACLAVRLSSDFGEQPGPFVIRDADQWRLRFMGRFGGTRPASGVYF